MERKRLYIIGGIVLGVMVVIALLQLLLPKNGSLTIVAPKNSPINVTVTNKDGEYNKTFLIDAGAKQQMNLRADSYKVDSSLGGLRSMDVFEMKEGESKTLNVSFAATSSASQISVALDNCPAVIGGGVFDYDCVNGGFVFKLDGVGTKEILFDSQFFDYLVPYQNGFLGVPQDGTVNYIDVLAGTMQPINVPQEMNTSDALQQMFITTSSDPAKKYFALSLDESDAVYIYKDVTDANPTKVKLTKKDALSREGYMSSLSFEDDKLVVFTGPFSDQHNEEGTTRQLAAPEPVGSGGSIVEYGLDGEAVGTLSTPEGFLADKLIKLNDNYYAADRIEGTEIFHREGNTLKSIYTVNDIVGVVAVNHKLYIQASNSINVFTPGEGGQFSIKSVYTPSDGQTLNNIYPGPGYLVFSATVPGIDVANVYRLDD